MKLNDLGSKRLNARGTALGSLMVALAAVAFAACGEAATGELRPIAESDKARVTVRADFGDGSIEGVGRQIVWLTHSDGWATCPESIGEELPPETCWIRVMVDDTQIAVLFPDQEGSLGPFPIVIHFGVFPIEPGVHLLQLVQSGRLEVRETAAVELVVRAPEAPPPGS
jgi:hypothetical protein